MTAVVVFVCSVAVYAAIPLLAAARRSRVQFLVLYTYIACVLTLGGLLGAVYVLPVVGDVSLLAGQVSYGAFMFATVVAMIVGRDVQVVRNIIVLTVSVNLVVYPIFHLSKAALDNADIPNPLGAPAAAFDQSLVTVLIGGTLIVAELVILLAVLEATKGRLGSAAMAGVYLSTFIAILALDGVLFTLLALHPGAGLGTAIVAGVKAKLVLAGAFSVFLLFFVAVYRPQIQQFEATPLRLADLLSVRRDPLLDQLAASTIEASRATATVVRILDAATRTVLIATDQHLRITHFNSGAQLLLDHREQDVLGRTPSMFITPAEVDSHAASLGTGRDLGSVIAAQAARDDPRDWTYLTAGGSARVLSLSVTEIRASGEFIGYLLAGEDVTERQRAERATAEALASEHAAVERLEEADRIKDELVSTVSHELRTPISSIQGYAELLRDGSYGDLTEAQATALGKLLRSTHRLEMLTEDLLFVARVDAGRAGPALVPIDLRAAVEAAHEHLEPLLRRRPDLEFDVLLPPEPVTVMGDMASLERLIVNLCGNAIKFTPGSGRVSVELEVAGEDVVLTVGDTGIGIAEDEVEKVFGRFFRSDDALRLAIPGSGLGLGVVHDIVTEHGGDIVVTSAPGTGTSIAVCLAHGAGRLSQDVQASEPQERLG